MSNDEQAPWEKVRDQSYFRSVMGNLVDLGFGPKNPVPSLRFGTTGTGHSPNYQIEDGDGTKHCFRGMGHGEATDAGDEFEASNLSAQTFSFNDVRDMLARVIEDGSR